MYRTILIVGTGGFIGSVMRYLLQVFIENKLLSTFPLATMIANIAGSFIIGVVFFTNAWKSSQSANQTISVTGSAKKEIVSDLGFLRGTISVQSSTSESAFAELNRQKPILISYLERKGFPKDKIEFNTINRYPVYEMSEQGYQTGRINGYIYSQRIEIQRAIT